MTMLGKAALRSYALKRQTIEVPAWGGEILLRELTAQEQTNLAVTGKLLKDAGKEEAKLVAETMALIIRLSWINEDGSPVLTSADTGELLSQPLHILQPIADAAIALSGMAAAAAEEAKKNSTKTQSAASGSDSQPSSAAAQ